MVFLDALASAVLTVLKFALWSMAAVLGLAFVTLALALLLIWVLVNRLLGRQPPVSLSARVQGLRQFSATFRSAGFRTSGFGARHSSAQAVTPETSQNRRIPSSGPVEDVQARDLPDDRSRS